MVDYVYATHLRDFYQTHCARGGHDWSSFTVYPRAFHNLPAYLTSTNHMNPTGVLSSNSAHVTGKEITYMEDAASDPHHMNGFQQAMKVYSEYRMKLTETYPTEQLLLDLKPDRAVLMDVGGGHGQDIERFRFAHPDLQPG